MNVIDEWSGRHACALQAAMRATNEQFARRLGVAVRTVASWHSTPGTVPRPEMQEALDTLHEQANEAVQRRFQSLMHRAVTTDAQALQVAIAVAVRGDEILLVCRRGGAGITWQFPAGVVKPGHIPDAVAVQETHAETGVHCSVRQHLGSRLHPVTGVVANYFLADYLAGEARNVDPLENTDVVWAPIKSLTKFIPLDSIYPPVMAALEGTRE
ncbi:NUDIX hydrolase [Streptomyces sp. NPDC015125]|uniref:NUDIX hydrolase n=1 Tax=Streptomyces sp. NPDC015125 TaxID=3364938 RepID=UPI00370327B5